MRDFKRIIWLASYPKSGNTWLRALISAYISGGHLDINRMVGCLGDQGLNFYQSAASFPLSTQTPFDQILMLRPAALLNLVARTREDENAIVKTHEARIVVNGFDTIPAPVTKKALYVVRDPRDVALSFSEHIGESLDAVIESMCSDTTVMHMPGARPRTVIGPWHGHVHSWNSCDKFPVATIRYEDLLSDPFGKARKALQWLEFDVNEDRLKHAVVASRFWSLREQERTNGFREKSDKDRAFFKRGTAGGWRTVLTDRQVARLESVNGETMRQLGYELVNKQAA